MPSNGLIFDQAREYVKCSCGYHYSNPFKCSACGALRNGAEGKYTFLEVEKMDAQKAVH